MSGGYRQSALLLHAIGLPDRQWVLERLTDGQRTLLREQLEELRVLGIPADPALAADVLASSDVRPAQAGPLATLRRAKPEAIWSLLAREPSWMIATILSIEPWPWREAVVNALDASQRERVRQGAFAEVPAKLAQHIVDSLAARLPAGGSPLALPPPPQSWQWLRNVMGQGASWF